MIFEKEFKPEEIHLLRLLIGSGIIRFNEMRTMPRINLLEMKYAGRHFIIMTEQFTKKRGEKK